MSRFVGLIVAALACMVTPCAWGQRARFPSTDPMPTTNLQPSLPNMVPLGQPPAAPPYPNTTAPQATLGVPSLSSSFDPYGAPTGSGSLFGGPRTGNSPSIFPSGMFNNGSVFGTPSAYQSAVNSPPPYSPSPVGPAYAPPEAIYPSTIYPNASPPALFPNGFLGPGTGVAGGGFGGYADALGMPQAIKFIQGPRLRQTYVSGGEGANELGIDDTDTSVAMTFPNFLWSTQPLYILPSFGLHLFDGPAGPPADLPPSVYDAFIAAGWQSDPNQILGAELGFATGVFTDFDTISSDSIRIMGTALGKLRITPTSTLKLGAMYIDRNKTKLIPAGGILWQPTPYSRFDIYFPSPKLAWYLTTLGTYDVWAYVSGEYGGGTWTIERANGTEDSIDINDIRLIGGIEWGISDLIRAGRRTGFIEGGWVTSREILYYKSNTPDVDLNDAFMVRAGIGY